MNKTEHITIVYFSPMGDTRRACLNLVMKMEKKVKDADLCSLGGEHPFGPEDTVTMGVLVSGGRIPGYVAEKLTYPEGGGAVAPVAVVYGNRAFEGAPPELDDCLGAQGFRIGAGTALLAEHSVVRDVATGRPDNQDREEMADSGARILEKLEEEDWQEPQVPGNRPYRDWRQMPVIPPTNASRMSCGLCAARCPVQAIPVSNPSPTGQARCILCTRRISVCPVKARSLPKQACAMLEQKPSPIRNIRRENEPFL